MEKGSDGFVRADQIDLKRLDEQLERHLNRAWTLEKKQQQQQQQQLDSDSIAAAVAAVKQPRQDWEIDPTKLIIKGVLARGTFGTVHRGVYDGQDVAGHSPSLLKNAYSFDSLYFLIFCSVSPRFPF